MDIFDYIKQSARTAKDPRIVMSELNGHKINVLNAAIGMVGEYSEFMECNFTMTTDKVSKYEELVKEAGDFNWYLAEMYREFPTLNPKFVTVKYGVAHLNDRYNKRLVFGTMLEIIKKYVWHNKQPDLEKLQMYIDVAVAEMSSTVCFESMITYNQNNFPETDILQINIDKLKLRYPDLYSDDHSAERLDEHYHKEKIAEVIIKSTLASDIIPTTPEQFVEMLSNTINVEVKFPTDIRDNIVKLLGFDPEETGLVTYEGLVTDQQHQI